MNFEISSEFTNGNISNSGFNDNLIWSSPNSNNINDYFTTFKFDGQYSIIINNANYLTMFNENASKTLHLDSTDFIIEFNFIYESQADLPGTLFYNSYGHIELYLDDSRKFYVDYYYLNNSGISKVTFKSKSSIKANTVHNIKVKKEGNSLLVLLNDNTDNPLITENLSTALTGASSYNLAIDPIKQTTGNTTTDYHDTGIGYTWNITNSGTIYTASRSNLFVGNIYISRFNMSTNNNSSSVDPPTISPTYIEVYYKFKTTVYGAVSISSSSYDNPVIARSIRKMVTKYYPIEMNFISLNDLDDEPTKTLFELVDKDIFSFDVNEDTNTLSLYYKKSGESSVLLQNFAYALGNPIKFDDTWNHIAMTYDKKSKEFAFFFNGKKIYTTNTMTDLDISYILLNTIKITTGGTFFKGVKISDIIRYTNNFDKRLVDVPSEPYASVIQTQRNVVRSSTIWNLRGDLDLHTLLYLRFELFKSMDAYDEYLDIYDNDYFTIDASMISTYYKNVLELPVWSSYKALGPSSDSTSLKPGIVTINRNKYINPHYADNWTIEFWLTRYDPDPITSNDIITIGNLIQEFTLVGEGYIDTTAGADVSINSLQQLEYKQWTHIAFVYDDSINSLYIYINGKRLYRSSMIKLASPTYIILNVGSQRDDTMYISGFKFSNVIRYKSNFNHLDQSISWPCGPYANITDSLRRIIVDQSTVVGHLFGGLTDRVIDYRLFRKMKPIVNMAKPHPVYGYDVRFYSWKIYNDLINIDKSDPNAWDEVTTVGPENSIAIGVIEYISNKEEVQSYSIDFWFKMSTPVMQDHEAPLIEIKSSATMGMKIASSGISIDIYTLIDSNTWNLNSIYSGFNFTTKWHHLAVTYDIFTRLFTVFINGKRIHETSQFTALSANLIDIFMNYTNRNKTNITSIRITEGNIFPDEFDIKTVNHPFDNTALVVPTVRENIPIILYDVDYKLLIIRNVQYGPDAPIGSIVPDPTEKPKQYNTRFPIIRTARSIISDKIGLDKSNKAYSDTVRDTQKSIVGKILIDFTKFGEAHERFPTKYKQVVHVEYSWVLNFRFIYITKPMPDSISKYNAIVTNNNI